MEDKLISEGNELLAKFMNVSIVQSKTSMAKFYHSDEFTLVNGKLAFAYNLKFDKDWNWLMKIIEKIESIDNSDVLIYNHICYIDFKHGEYMCDFHRWENSSKIEMTFIAIVKFLNWYYGR